MTHFRTIWNGPKMAKVFFFQDPFHYAPLRPKGPITWVRGGFIKFSLDDSVFFEGYKNDSKLSRPLWIIIQIDSFQDPMFICSTKTVQIDSFQDPCIGLHSVFIQDQWETPFKMTVLNLHGRLPSGNWFFQDHFTQWISDSFQDPCESYVTFSEWTPFKTIQKRKRTQSTLQYSFSDLLGLLSRPCTSEIKKTHDTGQPDRSFIIIITL